MQETRDKPPVAVAQTMVDFDPFPGEPALLSFCSHCRRPWLVWVPIAALGAAVLIIAVIQPSSGNLVGQVCADLHGYLHMQTSGQGSCAGLSSSYFPISRDVLSLGAAVVLACTPLLVRRQWNGYATLVTHMYSRGSLQFPSANDLQRFRHEVERANRHIAIIGRLAPLTMLFSGAAILVLMTMEQRDGVFYSLAPNSANRHMWALAAYSSWWAAPQKDPFGSLVYFVFATWGIYTITQQNLVGLRVIWAFWRSRHLLDFGADPINKDGYFGWLPAKDIVAATYTEVVIHGFALVCVAATLSPGSFFGPLAIASIQWLVTLPVYVSFPPLFTRNKILKYKVAEIERLDAETSTLDQTRPLHERIAAQDALGARIAAVRSIPTLPFKSPRDVLLFVIAFAANVLAIMPALITLLLRH